MAFSANGSGQQSEINVTPLIDVLLVLLIIFMVIVPIAPRGLRSQVPQDPSNTSRALGPVSLRVLGGAAGQSVRYEVDGRDVGGAQGLATALVEALRVRADRAVYVSATKDVSYGDAARAVAAANGAGASTVGLGRL